MTLQILFQELCADMSTFGYTDRSYLSKYQIFLLTKVVEKCSLHVLKLLLIKQGVLYISGINSTTIEIEASSSTCFGHKVPTSGIILTNIHDDKIEF